MDFFLPDVTANCFFLKPGVILGTTTFAFVRIVLTVEKRDSMLNIGMHQRDAAENSGWFTQLIGANDEHRDGRT